MAKLAALTAGNYLSAIELGDTTPTVMLLKLVQEQMQDRDSGKMQDKYVAYFVGAQKGLVMNKTNLTALLEMGIEDTDEIPDGLYVELYTVETSFGKGVRLRRGAAAVVAAPVVAAAPPPVISQAADAQAADAQAAAAPPVPQQVLTQAQGGPVAPQLAQPAADDVPF